MTRSRQSPQKHTQERRRNRKYPRNSAISREVPSSPERLRECSPASFEVIPLAVAIFLIGAIGIIAAAHPSPPREISAPPQLERQIARQALAVELAAERLRRRTAFPFFE